MCSGVALPTTNTRGRDPAIGQARKDGPKPLPEKRIAIDASGFVLAAPPPRRADRPRNGPDWMSEHCPRKASGTQHDVLWLTDLGSVKPYMNESFT